MALEDGVEGEVVGTSNDARVALLEQINDTNDREMADQYANVNDDGTTEAFTVKSAEGDETPLIDETVKDAEAEASIEAMAEETREPEPEPQRFKIKVNGKEMFLTQDELVARAQKIEAADQYLAEAARLRQEQEAKSQVSREDSAQSQVDDDLAIARAIQMGTEEEAVAALRKLRSPTVTAADISRTIDERLTFNEALTRFKTEYKDITSDPVLNQLAIDTDNKLIASGDTRSYYERYKDIGDTLRGKVKEWTKQATPAPVQGEEKLQRKAAVPAVPKAASQKTESSIEEEKEESVSDVIAGIAKSRGGPQWMQTRH